MDSLRDCLHQDRQKVHCLAVGIDFYTHHELAPDLRYASHDAERVWKMVQSTHPGSVARLLVNRDATAKNILRVAKELVASMEEDDLFLFSFSGHGSSVEVPRLKNGYDAVLLTADFSDGDLVRQEDGSVSGGIFLDQLAEIVANSRCNNLLVLSDACHSGTAITGSREVRPTTTVQPNEFEGEPRIRTLTGNPRRFGKSHSDRSEQALRLEINAPGISNQFILAASEGEAPAFEVDQLEQGALTYAFLEWWSDSFSPSVHRPDDSVELGTSLESSIKSVYRRLRGKFLPASLSDPTVRRNGKILLDRNTSIGHIGLPLNYWHVGRAGATRSMRWDATHFDQSVTEIVGFLTEDSKVLCFTNLVVTAPPMSGIRDVMDEVATRVSRAFEGERPVYHLGWGAMQNLFPIDGTIVGACKTMEQFAPRSPEARKFLNDVVKRLEDSRATLIVPYFPDAVTEQTEAILKASAASPDINLVLVVGKGSHYIPTYLRRSHYRVCSVKPYSLEAYQEESSSVNLQQLEERGLLNWRTIRWMTQLEKSEFSQDDLNPIKLPEQNPTRVQLDLLRNLLDLLKSKAPDALTLLRAFCATDLPRSEELVAGIFDRLKSEDFFVKEEAQLGDCLLQLQEFGLIDESKHEPRYWFVHHIVKDGVDEQISGVEADLEARTAMTRLVAGIYRDAAKKHECKACWPNFIAAFQATRMFMRIDAWDEAANVLVENWKGLVSAGFHTHLMNWSTFLHGKLTIHNECELLLKRQNLQIHLQQWQDAIGIEKEVKARVRDALDRESCVNQRRLSAIGWQSVYYSATAHLASGKCEIAISLYESCLDWAATQGDEKLESACRNRLVELAAMSGSIRDGLRLLGEARNCLESGSSDSSNSSKAYQLDTYEFHLARIREDPERTYELAIHAWKNSLASDYPDKLLSAGISRIHMGWACLLRTEYARALRHGVAARTAFIKRGVPEDWWIGLAQQVIGLSLAWTWRARIGGSSCSVCPSYTSEYPTRVEARKRMVAGLADVTTREISALEEQIDRARLVTRNHRRECELMSALGQLLHFSGADSGRGEGILKAALDIADATHHTVMQVYLHETLAYIVETPEESRKHQETSIEIAKEELIEGIARRETAYRALTGVDFEAAEHDWSENASQARDPS